MRALLFSILTTGLACLAPALGAQGVTVRATALTELRASANAVTNTIAANTDLTNGAQLSAIDANPVWASANLAFGLVHTPSSSRFTLEESGYGAINLNFTQPGGAGSVGRHGIQVVYTSPRPMQATLTVRYCTSWGNSTTSGYASSLELVGHGTITPTANDGPCVFGYAHTQTFAVTIDAAGLTFILDTHGWCVGTTRGGAGVFSGRWEVTLTPDQDFPCTPTPYGAGCGGATLGASTDFDGPGTHLLTLDDPGAMAIAFIAFGTQRRSIPFPPNCTVLNDLVLALPATVSQGRATLRFVPPSIPGLVFQTQGVVGLANLNLDLSNGVEFVCP